MELDLRVVKVGIEIQGKLKTYQELDIHATGSKYASSIQNECEIKIANLDKNTRNYLQSVGSPYIINRFNRIQSRVFIDVGRVSYGTTRIFSGNIFTADCSQAPDIGTTIRCLTGNYSKYNGLIARSQPGMAPLSKIAGQVAQDIGTGLVFEAQDKQVANYNFSGAPLKQVNALGAMGGIEAYVDDDNLVVKKINTPLRGKIKIINANNGMIGTPVLTELGVQVKYLLDTTSVLGGLLRLQSQNNPAANGDWVIYKLSFEVTNRDKPFSWTAEARRAT